MNIRVNMWVDFEGDIVNIGDTIYVLAVKPDSTGAFYKCGAPLNPDVRIMKNFKKAIHVVPAEVYDVVFERKEYTDKDFNPKTCQTWALRVKYDEKDGTENQFNRLWVTDYKKIFFKTREEAEHALKYFDQKYLRYDVKKMINELLDKSRLNSDFYRYWEQHMRTGNVSDGYHTFDELYDHRAVLFAALCNTMPENAWKSRLHEDGTMYDGMFIVGLDLPEGPISYHIEERDHWGRSNWELFKCTELPRAVPFDGYTPDDVVDRLIMHCGGDPNPDHHFQEDSTKSESDKKIGSDYFVED